MKKVNINIILLVLITLLFSIGNNVKAEEKIYTEWTCIYSNSTVDFALFIDENFKVYNVYTATTVSYDVTNILNKIWTGGMNGKCPEKMYVNNHGVSSGVMYKPTGEIAFNASGDNSVAYSLYTSELDDDIRSQIKVIANAKQITTNEELKNKKDVTDNALKNQNPEGALKCEDIYNNIYSEANIAASSYKVCGSNCKKDLAEYKKQKQNLKDFCHEILNSYNYSDEDKKNCIDKCLSIEEDIKVTDKLVNSSGANQGSCFMSANLTRFLKNIIRWVKYIIPVLLIILSIFDFIKAIANEDDGMKRAKKHLINRLIAIILIFTIPSFIEFFLDKFGFVSKECSILMIKLLK